MAAIKQPVKDTHQLAGTLNKSNIFINKKKVWLLFDFSEALGLEFAHFIDPPSDQSQHIVEELVDFFYIFIWVSAATHQKVTHLEQGASEVLSSLLRAKTLEVVLSKHFQLGEMVLQKLRSVGHVLAKWGLVLTGVAFREPSERRDFVRRPSVADIMSSRPTIKMASHSIFVAGYNLS